MTDKESAGAKARAFFDGLWSKGDFWAIESDPYEAARLAALVAAIPAGRHARALELGCGAGAFTRRLADVANHVLAVDVSEKAIDRAKTLGLAGVEFRAANVLDLDLRRERPWDLVVMSETIYYLGWLYSFFDVGWLASEIRQAMSPGGHLLLANTEAECEDPLVLPWLIRTYRDLFANVGFAVESERVWRGVKDGMEMGVRITVFKA